MQSMVEGLACLTGGNDGADDRIQIGQNVASRNPERPEAEGRQLVVAAFIASRLIAAVMDLTIDFDRQPCRETSKVETIDADRVLAAKLESTGSRAKYAPECDLGQVAATALSSRHLDRSTCGGENPSTTRLCRAVPLPVPGRYVPISHHIRNTPNVARSGTGALRQAASARPSTSRVCAGSMMPSSHRCAVAFQGLPSSSYF